MKKVVISGYYGFNNFGDEAILDVLVQALRDSDTDITVLSSNPELTAQQYEVNSFGMFSLADVIHQIFVADILISGGGSLLQDKTSKKSFLYYILVLLVGIIFKKKVVIFAQGIEAPSNKYLEKILTWVLSKTDYLSVRDNKSASYLKSIGIKAKKFSDPIWSVPNKKVEQTTKVIVQLRAWPNLDTNKLNIIANIISTKFPDSKIEILPLQESSDNNLSEELCSKLELLDIEAEVLYDLSKNEIIEKIASAKYLIAMRYHACLAAIKQKIPTLAISYDNKVKNLAKEFGLPYIEIDRFSRSKMKIEAEKLDKIEINTALLDEKIAQSKESINDIIRLVDNIEVFD